MAFACIVVFNPFEGSVIIMVRNVSIGRPSISCDVTVSGCNSRSVMVSVTKDVNISKFRTNIGKNYQYRRDHILPVSAITVHFCRYISAIHMRFSFTPQYQQKQYSVPSTYQYRYYCITNISNHELYPMPQLS